MNIHWDEITQDNLRHMDRVLNLYYLVFPLVVREPHTIFLMACIMHSFKSLTIFVS